MSDDYDELLAARATDEGLPTPESHGRRTPAEEEIPRCPAMDGSTLRIVPSYIEAGRMCEANCVTITDGERTVVYVPYAVAR